MGYATSLPMLYALYCAAGMGAAFVYSGSIGSALKWFKDSAASPPGIMAAGFGGGTALFIPIISSIDRIARISDGVHRDRHLPGPRDRARRAVPATSAAEAATGAGRAAGASQVGRRHFTTLEMLRTPQFYVMYAMFVLMATGGLLVTANAGPIARVVGLHRPARSRWPPRSVPLANGASRVFWGWASDRLGRENDDGRWRSCCRRSACSWWWRLGSAPAAGSPFTLVLVYFTWGEIYSLFPATVGDYFGTRHATSNYARALHRQGRGVDHRRLGRRAALRAVRQLGDGLLRQRVDGARRGGDGRGPARAPRPPPRLPAGVPAGAK